MKDKYWDTPQHLIAAVEKFPPAIRDRARRLFAAVDRIPFAYNSALRRDARVDVSILAEAAARRDAAPDRHTGDRIDDGVLCALAALGDNHPDAWYEIVGGNGPYDRLRARSAANGNLDSDGFNRYPPRERPAP